ncbi:MAG TPA: PQQ-binding-like beta-propeller repeat protein [Planctomycetota bacterium]|nr:PQQ-binding-like beta-propeller repeat protein [Planctomycetota bacterium]
MLKTNTALCVLLALSLPSLSSLPCLASDWPQWRGPDRTGHVATAEKVPVSLPADGKPVWKLPVGEGFASPVVSGGKVFYLANVVADEHVFAADAATGKELWKSKLFASHKDGFGIGPRCTPLVDGKLLFVQSCKGEFQCLNAEDGKQIWRKNFVDDFGAVFIGEKGQAAGGSRHGNCGSPLVDGPNIYVLVGSPKAASVVCFKKETGEVVWQSQNDQTAYAPPMMATLAGVKQLIVFTIEGLIGLGAADGKLLWRVPMKTNFGRHVTTPVIVGDLVMVASHQVGLIATRIVKDGGSVKAEPAWTLPEMKINFSSPVAAGDHIYACGPAKNIVCINAKDGTLAWEKTGLINSAADKAHASFLVMGANILMLNDSGQLILFAADPKEYKEVSRMQVCGFNWCNPAYGDGKLYVRDNKELQCVNLLP